MVNAPAAVTAIFTVVNGDEKKINVVFFLVVFYLYVNIVFTCFVILFFATSTSFQTPEWLTVRLILVMLNNYTHDDPHHFFLNIHDQSTIQFFFSHPLAMV